MTDVATTMREERYRPSTGDWLISVSMSQEIQHPQTMMLHCSTAWQWRGDMTQEIYLYELIVSFLCCMLGTDGTNGKSRKLF